jgi:protocatechuate 3,4-dioxygenase beta subunit
VADGDRLIGRVLTRREVLWLGGGAGTALAGVALARHLPDWAAVARLPAPSTAAAAEPPTCVVRPQQTEGPYFVDEKLLRSDIRSDPSDGSVRPGTPLALAFTVSRLDGGVCTPYEGVLVDVWHCDAAGVYSDVHDPSGDTTGKKFLRGYQVTDAAGAASFVTIYPGWYPGRTVHIHVKLRTEPAAAAALEFTSQVYFDDALSDDVYAAEPYAGRGERSTRNADDAIYAANGSQLMLTVVPDGSGGYAASFHVAIQFDGPSDCATIADCVEALRGVLPTPTGAADAAARRVARRLQRRMNRLAALLDREGGGSTAQTKRFATARTRLDALLALSRQADQSGKLGVTLAPIENAVAALLAMLL